jgi:hypothetical protein
MELKLLGKAEIDKALYPGASSTAFTHHQALLEAQAKVTINEDVLARFDKAKPNRNDFKNDDEYYYSCLCAYGQVLEELRRLAGK